jgi:uridine kinase
VEERSKTNFDHPDSLDTDLLVQHIRELKSGKTADLPNYDFATHSRTPITDLVHPKPIIIVEGILILTSADLCKECDMKVFVVRCLFDDEKVKDIAAKLILCHLLYFKNRTQIVILVS